MGTLGNFSLAVVRVLLVAGAGDVVEKEPQGSKSDG